jgi:ribosome recycling factor
MTTIASSKDAMAQARVRMEKAVEDFRKELAGTRTGRANVTLLDHIRVDYHGTSMPVNQLGTLSVPEPTMIIISPWDPSAVPLIDKAIRTSDLGLNPTNDGKIVRVPIPPCATSAETSRKRSKNSRRKRRSAKTNASGRWKSSKNSRTRRPKKSKISAP